MRELDPRLVTLFRELVAFEESDAFTLHAWFEGYAHKAAEVMSSLADENAYVPEEFWHYISDADNRIEDPVYGAEQRADMKDLLKEQP